MVLYCQHGIFHSIVLFSDVSTFGVSIPGNER